MGFLIFAIWLNWGVAFFNAFGCLMSFSHGKIGLGVYQLCLIVINVLCALWCMRLKKEHEEREKGVW